MKKVLALTCAVICTVMACVVPCWAETWEEENPEYDLPFGSSPMWANGMNNTELVIEAVEKATALGIFGGAQPVQIYYQFQATNTALKVMVAVPASSSQGFYYLQGEKGVVFRGRTNGTNQQYVSTSSSATDRVPWTLYCLHYNGDWSVANHFTAQENLETSNLALGQQGTVIYKRVATWSTATEEWVKPDESINTADIIGWGLTTTEFAGISSIIEKYDRQISLLNPEPVGSYELNIGEIFDGYFGGVRNVLSAFDINLFGINIVGVLIALLVIAIVAFIVRKLWK